MRVTLLQYAPAWEDRQVSREKVAALVAGLSTDWLVLPEMALSGFTMDRAAATWDASDEAFFAGLAKELRCAISVGAVRDRHNVCLVFGPEGRILASYAKRHLFSYAGEEARYDAGREPRSYELSGLRISQSICYDLRFPADFWQEAPNVDAFCVIAAWGGKRAEHWRLLLRARAIENQCFAIGVNRIGIEPSGLPPGVEYSGDSAVIDPQGRTLLDCGSAEGAFSVEIDPAAVAQWRSAFPALKDRRAQA